MSHHIRGTKQDQLRAIWL